MILREKILSGNSCLPLFAYNSVGALKLRSFIYEMSSGFEALHLVAFVFTLIRALQKESAFLYYAFPLYNHLACFDLLQLGTPNMQPTYIILSLGLLIFKLLYRRHILNNIDNA